MSPKLLVCVTVLCSVLIGFGAPPLRFDGRIAAISGNEMTVESWEASAGGPLSGERVIIPLKADIPVTLDYEPATVAALTVGMEVLGIVHSDGLSKGRIIANSESLRGRVTSIEDMKLKVRPEGNKNEKAEVELSIQKETRILCIPHDGIGKPQKVTASDLRPGMDLRVVPPTGVAKLIYFFDVQPVGARTTTQPSTKRK